MLTRTWPYGTVKRGRVLRVDDTTTHTILTVEEIDPTAGDKGGFILIDRRGDAIAKPGDMGTMVFTKGGPTGGYWKFTPDPGTTPEE